MAAAAALILGALAPFFACDATGPGVGTGAGTGSPAPCAQEPEPECYACPEAGTNVAVCEQNVWVCPTTGPCSSDDAGSDGSAEAGPVEAGPVSEGGMDAAEE